MTIWNQLFSDSDLLPYLNILEEYKKKLKSDRIDGLSKP